MGGSCVEVESGDQRIVLDVGKPLTAGWSENVALPGVPGLADGSDPGLLAVLVTHPHLDHYGLVDQVAKGIAVYAGAGAAAVVGAARFFAPGGPALVATGHLEDRVPIRLGSFTVTPHLVDHSAYDSYALVVDGAGKRLMYTGDLRGHGRKGRLFEQMLHEPPSGVDTLLMEGTHVPVEAPPGAREPALTEAQVEHDMADTFRATCGLSVVISSAQNLDRLVTVYRAARRAGRTLLVDLYTATVAQATGRSTIPQPGFPSLGVYIPLRQRVLVKRSGQFHRTLDVRQYRIFPEELTAHPHRYVLLTSTSTVAEIVRAGQLRDGSAVWSLWPGYLAEPSGQRLEALLQVAGVPLVHHHTSGHAPVVDLQRLAKAVDPQRIVPIHTEGAEQFDRYFDHVSVQADGSWGLDP